MEKEILFGGSFNDNSSRNLLKNVDILKGILPSFNLEFYDVFHAFNNVVISHFGSEYDELNADKYILEFRRSYEKLCSTSTLRCTPKVHAILFHVPQFCKNSNRGLGIFNEQAFEAVHAEFKNTWIRFKRSVEHPTYGDKILRAVCVFNAGHVNPD